MQPTCRDGKRFIHLDELLSQIVRVFASLVSSPRLWPPPLAPPSRRLGSPPIGTSQPAPAARFTRRPCRKRAPDPEAAATSPRKQHTESNMAMVNDTRGMPVLVSAKPPDGWVVNLENPTRELNPGVYYVYIIGNILALLFLLQRLYTKIILMKLFQWDDACLVGAWIFSLLTQIPAIYEYSLGNWGVHMWELPVLGGLDRFLWLIYMAPIYYSGTQALSKLTILLFYHRISPVASFIHSVNFTIFVCMGYLTGILFALIFANWPLRKSWDPTFPADQGVKLVDLTQVYIATTVLGVITDFMILTLPLPTIFRLQVTKAQKYGLAFIFFIGSITFTTSIVRLILLIPTIGATDVTWVIAQPTMWVSIEANLFIMCGSLPTLRKFAKQVVPKVLGSNWASKFGYSGNSGSASRGTGGNASGHKLSAGKLSVTGGSKGGFDRLEDPRTDPESLRKYGYEMTVNGESDLDHTRHDSGSERAIVPEAHAGPSSGIVQTRTTTVEYGGRV
ncbi:hypothetical protein RB595_007821 [Gaeumannomyces hyphopodioides]